MQHDRATAQLFCLQGSQLRSCNFWHQESDPCLLYLAPQPGWRCSCCWFHVVLQQILALYGWFYHVSYISWATSSGSLEINVCLKNFEAGTDPSLFFVLFCFLDPRILYLVIEYSAHLNSLFVALPIIIVRRLCWYGVASEFYKSLGWKTSFIPWKRFLGLMWLQRSS